MDPLQNFALQDVAVDTSQLPPAEAESIFDEPAPPAPVNPNLPQLGAFRNCRHCGAEYPASVKGACPGCGKSQAGRKAGSTAARREPAPAQEIAPQPPPKTEKEMMQIEQAIGDTFAFACEDIIAPFVLKIPNPPPFGENRAARLGAVWAPILAPFLNGPFILALLALAITVRGIGSYYRECVALRDKNAPI